MMGLKRNELFQKALKRFVKAIEESTGQVITRKASEPSKPEDNIEDGSGNHLLRMVIIVPIVEFKHAPVRTTDK